MGVQWLWDVLGSGWALAVFTVGAAASLSYWTLLCTMYLKQADVREAYAVDLERVRFQAQYHHGLQRGLDWLDRVFGSRLLASWRGIGVCVAISFVYVFTGFLVGWMLGGPDGVGRLKVLPADWPAWARTGFGGFLAAIVATMTVAPRIDSAILFRLRRCKWQMVAAHAGIVYRVGTGLISGAIMFPTFTVTGVNYVVVLALAIFLVSASGPGPSLALKNAVAPGLAIAPLVAIAMAVAILGSAPAAAAPTAILALAGFLVLRLATNPAVAAALAVFLSLFIAFLVPVVLALAAVFGALSGKGFAAALTSLDSAFLFLFLLLLPFANAALDWLSLAVSRDLGRKLVRRPWGWWRLAAHTLLDLCAALGFLVAVAFSIPFLIEIYNLSVVPSGNSKPLDLADSIHRALAPRSWGDRLWIAVMLFSTLLPTFAHLTVLFAGLWTQDLGRLWRMRTIERLRLREAGSRDDMKIAGYLTLRWVVPAIPAALVFILLALAAQAIWHADLAELLYDVAQAGLSTAGWMLGV